jgi:cell division protein ZapE
MAQSIAAHYEARTRRDGFQCDAAQAEVAACLDDLASRLADWRLPQRGLFGILRRRSGGEAPRGIYVHGQVGRGKTMLMDMFFEHVAFRPKRRIHFHEFMSEVHERIAAARKSVPGDPIPTVARDIAQESRLLCFDELHVTDIADAMILGRLFEGMFEEGIVVVATSNAMPDELYKDGLNRNLFVPFIRMIEERMTVVELDSAEDYRLQKLAGRPLYFTPADKAARREMDKIFKDLTGVENAPPTELEVKGRRVPVPQAAHGVARFAFEELCARPLGAADYLAIARQFHTVIIDGIPALSPAKRNEARRFVNLIDTLYDQRVGVIVSAETDVDGIYKEGDGAFFFERTRSRLIEMRSEDYLAKRKDRAQALNTGEGAEAAEATTA